MKSENNNIIQYSKGPQFQIKGGVFLFFLSFALIVIAIAGTLVGKSILIGLFLFPGILLLIYVLNIRGFEINTKSNQIKEYKKFLWMRIGNWEKLKNYTCLCLTKGKLNVPTSDYSEHSIDTYFYFFVKLVNEINKKELILFSHTDYFQAKEFLDKMADIIGLEVKIKIKSLKKI